MAAQLHQAVAALRMGRSGNAVAAAIGATLATGGGLWFAVCLFLTLEPLP